MAESGDMKTEDIRRVGRLSKGEILAMTAGIELDELVAIHVMRYEPGTVTLGGWNPSINITAAWEVAERFETIEIQRFVTDKGLWFCEIKEKIWHRSFGNTAPEAICKAALLTTIGVDNP